MIPYSLYIKNLNCKHSIGEVSQEFKIHNIQVKSIINEEIILAEKPNQFKLKKIRVILRNNESELIIGRRQKIIEKIKGLIKNMIFNYDDKIHKPFSDYISANIELNYNDLSRLFSSTQGITIEKYYITERINRFKHLLIYEEETVKEIAGQLGYSSVHHLSQQFKKETGETIRSYKEKHNVVN